MPGSVSSCVSQDDYDTKFGASDPKFNEPIHMQMRLQNLAEEKDVCAKVPLPTYDDSLDSVHSKDSAVKSSLLEDSWGSSFVGDPDYTITYQTAWPYGSEDIISNSMHSTPNTSNDRTEAPIVTGITGDTPRPLAACVM